MCKDILKRACPRCENEMELKVKSYPMGSVFQMNRFHVDIYQCPDCQRVELFAAEGEMVACPICGVSHPAQERCVNCALDAAFGGRKA